MRGTGLRRCRFPLFGSAVESAVTFAEVLAVCLWLGSAASAQTTGTYLSNNLSSTPLLVKQ